MWTPTKFKPQRQPIKAFPPNKNPKMILNSVQNIIFLKTLNEVEGSISSIKNRGSPD